MKKSVAIDLVSLYIHAKNLNELYRQLQLLDEHKNGADMDMIKHVKQQVDNFAVFSE